jgi:pyridoxamine 5'-phosphate oxidase
MTLGPENVDPDPIVQFTRWYEGAVSSGVRQPDAMTLATATTDGRVSARTVLLRGYDERGFVFYTNLESAKAQDLARNPRDALVFHWRELERQVRVVGPVTPVDQAESEQYWETRPRGHRIGAWASPQSQPIDEAELAWRVNDVESRYYQKDPPLPPFWGGLRVGLDELELWEGRTDRLHDRVRYRRSVVGYIRERLAP